MNARRQILYTNHGLEFPGPLPNMDTMKSFEKLGRSRETAGSCSSRVLASNRHRSRALPPGPRRNSTRQWNEAVAMNTAAGNQTVSMPSNRQNRRESRFADRQSPIPDHEFPARTTNRDPGAWLTRDAGTPITNHHSPITTHQSRVLK